MCIGFPFYFTKPSGGAQFGKSLYEKPSVKTVPVDIPLNMVFASDLHIQKQHTAMSYTVADAVSDLKPDMVFLGGDIAECDHGEILFLSALREKLPITPIYCVAGNNEDARFEKDRARLNEIFSAFAVHFLRNTCETLQINGKTLEIGGVEDMYTYLPNAENLFSADETHYKILLSHAPHSFLLNQCAPDLLLCGHTHGGQFNILGVTPYTVGYELSSRYLFVSGVKKIGKTLAVVTNGIGTSKIPLRIGAKSEIIYLNGRNHL